MGAIPRDTLENELRRIAALPPFIGFSEDNRGIRGLPHRLHFRFNYPAIEKGDPQAFILLAKLRSANPESFHYWTVVQDLLGKGR